MGINTDQMTFCRLRGWRAHLLSGVLLFSGVSTLGVVDAATPSSANSGEAVAQEVRLGKEAVAQNNLVVALEHFVKAHQLAPDNPDYLHSAAMLSRNLGKNEQALTFFRQAVALAGQAGKQADVVLYNGAIDELLGGMPPEVAEKISQVSAFPPEKNGVAEAWTKLSQESAALMSQGDVAGAIKRGLEAKEKAQSGLGPKHYAVLVSLRDLALVQAQSGAMAEAIPSLEQATLLATEILGAHHPETLQLQALQADLLESQAQFSQAVTLRQGVLNGWKAAFGADHPSTLAAGLVLARLNLNRGELTLARQWLDSTCARFAKLYGSFHSQGAECLALSAMVRGRQGETKAALDLYAQAGAIYKMALSPEDPTALQTRIDSCELMRKEGQFVDARQELTKIIEVAQKGGLTQQQLDAQGVLAQLLEDSGEYDQAEPLLNEVLVAERAFLGADHPNLLATQSKLAGVYRRQGRLVEAEKLYATILTGYRQLLGVNHPASITVMNNLGLIFESEGLYDEAEPLLRAALKSSRQVAGEESPETLATLNNLALLHESQGVFDKAEPLYQNAIQIATKALGANHPDTVAFVNNLAYLYLMQENDQEAAPLFEKVVALWSGIYGEAHQKTLKAMNNLARVRHKLGAKVVAEKLFLKTLALRKKVLGERHMDVMRTLRDLGALYADMGRKQEAEKLLKQALELDEQVLGPQHPYTFEALNTLAKLYESRNDKPSLQAALELRQKGFERRTEFLNRMLWATGDNAREGYVRLHREELDHYLALIARQANEVGGYQVLDVALHRKGLLLKITSEMRQVVQMAKNPQLEVLSRRLTTARKKLAALTLSGPTPETQEKHLLVMNQLEEKVDQLQLDLGRISKRFRRSVSKLSVDQLLEYLPEGSALLDFMVYSNRGDNRLVAGVLRKENGQGVYQMIPYRMDMDEIQKTIVDYRTSIQDEGMDETELIEAGQEAYDIIWGPLNQALADATVIYVVPDGMLNIAPFHALIDEDGVYLAKSLDLHILTSSRDLLPSDTTSTVRSGLLILAGPDYDSDQVVSHEILSAIEGKRSADLREGMRAFSQGMRGLHFDPLPGAEEEGKLIIKQAKEQKQKSQIFVQFDAQEQVVQSIETPPEILHIATHGFFLKADDSLKKRLLKLQRGGDLQMPPPGDNPLLRSGLAFAGVNGNASFLGEIDTRNDGVLTALEVLGLDLTGTKLAVLSACETGLGEIHEGEGVYGLRRAFQEAGVESVVASLWEVSDAGTQAMMTSLYKLLMAGKSPHEALRETRQELMDSTVWNYPYIWAAFMLVGK